MKKFIKLFTPILFCLLLCSQGYSVTTYDVFARHNNPIFIETGSCVGDGIACALKAGYKEIHSIELSPDFYQKCVVRFKNNPNVHLYLGDSSIVLKEILKNIKKPATFWLDGHYSWNGTARGDTNTPILKELAIIGDHSIKTHTILIDDVREFGTVEFDFIELDDILKALEKINPNYLISYENGYIANDVLVAEIKNK